MEANLNIELLSDGGYIPSMRCLTYQNVTFSRKELTDALAELSTAFKHRRVGVLCQDRLLASVVSLAAIEEGACIPLDNKATDRELSHILATTPCDLIVTDRHTYQTRKNILDGLAVIQIKRCGKQFLLSNAQDLPSADYFSEIALVLYTSGTTSEPKPIHLSKSGIQHSAISIIESLQLTQDDVSLNVLPLVHVGGLIDLLLAPLIAGGAVHLAEPKDLNASGDLLNETGVTWLQGSPAILQAVLDLQPPPLKPLRFIRSVSAPLPGKLYQALERTFNTPVIEMYGMSETSGVITSNTLEERKIGSVGKPIRCEVKIIDAQVWVKSESLFAPDPGDTAVIRDGWFMTGDTGYQDQDGFLFLTGRTKEIINRGGQKFSPTEVDNIVLSWDEVTDAACFGVAHATLSQEVALAVVLKSGATLPLPELKARLSSLVSEYKIPKKVYLLQSLPRNKNGKLKRFELESLVKNETEISAEKPLSKEEAEVLHIVRKCLKDNGISFQDDFFDAGGDSLSAATLIAAMEKQYQISMEGFSFIENSRIQDIAKKVASVRAEQRVSKSSRKKHSSTQATFSKRLSLKLNQLLNTWEAQRAFEGSYVMKRNHKPGVPHLFWCCNSVGEFNLMCNIAENKFNIFGLRTLHKIQHKMLRNIDTIGRVYAEHIHECQPEGELNLGGYCEGGRLMEAALKHLESKGRAIHHLFFHDFVPTRPVAGKISLLYCDSWKRNPLRIYSRPEVGWSLLAQQGLSVDRFAGSHAGFGQKEMHEGLKRLLGSHPVKSDFPSFSCEEFSVNYTKLPPRVLKCGRSYKIEGEVTNHGSETITPDHGFSIHSRWIDLAGILKFSAPSRFLLEQDLESGQSIKFSLVITPHNSKRLYRLDIAPLVEGSPWPLARSLNKWHFIL